MWILPPIIILLLVGAYVLFIFGGAQGDRASNRVSAIMILLALVIGYFAFRHAIYLHTMRS